MEYLIIGALATAGVYGYTIVAGMTRRITIRFTKAEYNYSRCCEVRTEVHPIMGWHVCRECGRPMMFDDDETQSVFSTVWPLTLLVLIIWVLAVPTIRVLVGSVKLTYKASAGLIESDE